MPFTPFHMGPGLLIKALLRGSFSLMVFGWAQILMDIQPLMVLLTGKGHLHGFTHTYLGATLIGAFSTLTGKYAAEFGLRILDQARFLPISWAVTVTSAFIGTYSHVILDSIMHSDLRPFAPWSLSNPMFRLVHVGTLHQICLFTGILGAILFFAVTRWGSKRKTRFPA